jgi:hypothetical protein
VDTAQLEVAEDIPGQREEHRTVPGTVAAAGAGNPGEEEHHTVAVGEDTLGEEELHKAVVAEEGNPEAVVPHRVVVAAGDIPEEEERHMAAAAVVEDILGAAHRTVVAAAAAVEGIPEGERRIDLGAAPGLEEGHRIQVAVDTVVVPVLAVGVAL